jgi:hypothetical protein
MTMVDGEIRYDRASPLPDGESATRVRAKMLAATAPGT